MPRAEWRVLVADDEPAARRGVRQLLAPYPGLVVVGECRHGAEVLASLDSLRPDVLFLDVQMPGIDGFEVIRRRTPARMPLVVLLTAYDQFALRGFEAQALDYLVKPVSEARFAAAVARVIRQLRLSEAAVPEARIPEARIVVTTATGAISLRVREIEWIEAADNYARIWVEGRGYLLRESLRDLEPRLRGHGFRRAHRQALVPLGRVRELRSIDGALVAVLANGVEVPVSRRRRAAFAATWRQGAAGRQA
jgi:two-component system LytT family response regulator